MRTLSSYLMTIDGHDGGTVVQPTSGIDAREMAHFMLDYLGVDQAMGMDQGGSTTMWIQDYGVVSNPGLGTRLLFGGLFIQVL